MVYARIQQALSGTGLICRGGFCPEASSDAPVTPLVPTDSLPDGAAVAAVVIIGNAGEAMWEVFSNSAEYARRADDDHTLNAWTKRVLDGVAADLNCRAVYPFDGPPYHPFQRWAMQADQVFPSPIGPLIHADYGLWHAYRGALLFAEPIDLPAHEPANNPCDVCPDRPCLSVCPVDAFSAQGYDVPHCVSHVETPAGADCIEQHCRARRACPIGREYQYVPDHARFHQSHFLRSNRTRSAEEPGF